MVAATRDNSGADLLRHGEHNMTRSIVRKADHLDHWNLVGLLPIRMRAWLFSYVDQDDYNFYFRESFRRGYRRQL